MGLRECENDFLSRKSDTTCVGLTPCMERTSGSHGKRVPGRTFNFPGIFKWTRVTLLLLFAVVSLFCQPVSGQSLERQPPEYSCVERQNHERFSQCFCGEFAHIIRSDEVQDFQDNGFEVFDRYHGKTKRIQQYYVCSKCTICGDGIKVIDQCTQRSDTKCSNSECQNPTWTFDFGSKSCRPPTTPRVPASTRATTTTTRRTTVVKGLVPTEEQEPEFEYYTDGSGLDDDEENTAIGSRAWLQQHSQVVVLALMGTVFLLIVCNIIIMVTMLAILRRLPRLGLQYSDSSQNTSRSSLPADPEKV